MDKIKLLDIFKIKQEILSRLDESLATHGEEVSYIVYKLAKELNYSDEYARTLAVISSMHDIGAYQTNYKNNIKDFEIINTEQHSAYSYSIIKNMDINLDLASIVLYHHHNYEDRFKYIDGIEIHQDTFLLSLADKVSILCNLSNYNKEKIISGLNYLSNRQFKQIHIDSIHKLVNEKLIDKIINKTYREELYEIFIDYKLSERRLINYASILPITINFFSIQTAMHIVSVRSISEKICDILNVDKSYKKDISFGASFHDLGKSYTPVSILKKKGKLTQEEFEIIKRHAIDTENILIKSGIDESIIRLASNHHEKLNGSGYPKGLTSNNLSIGDRIITIADIFCALTEKRYYKEELNEYKVISILNDMVNKNEIDNDIVQIVRDNFDELLNYKNIEYNRYNKILENMHSDFEEVSLKLKNL